MDWWVFLCPRFLSPFRHKASFQPPNALPALKILYCFARYRTRTNAARTTAVEEADILTIKQVADFLQVTERAIYRLAASDGIPAFKVGGSWRFRKSDVDAWIASQTSPAEGRQA